jgi:enamine deaminase RidA (YjgF/YER057c/UK114 family)
MTDPIQKLREYGYELPAPKAPVASYVPVTRSGNLLYVSGQISSGEGGVVGGRLGDTMNVQQGGNAAELAAINVLSQIVHSLTRNLPSSTSSPMALRT